MAKPSSISVKKRLLFVLFAFSFLVFGLLLRVAWLQIVQGDELQKRAHENQTQDNIINAKRGIIFDRNGEELAINVSVETVAVDPNEVKNSEDADPKEMAEILSNILDMEYEKVYKKITKNSYHEYIKRKIDKAVADKIRKAQAQGKLSGITIVDDKKRFYPYSDFASHVIGFTGFDNQGLNGVEAQYATYLKGLQGRISSAKDVKGREIPYGNERYIAPESGDNVYLTIDEVIQHFAEKSLKTAVVNNECKQGVAIVMNPKTGQILGFAVEPSYNLNKPFNPIEEEIKSEWDKLKEEEKSKKLQQMWRNPAISDTYEPGSTFKTVTASAALEEGVVKTTDMFNCKGHVKVAGHKIKCWRSYKPHGLQTFVEGVQNSCNPVFIEVAQRLGKEKFYKYIKGFGFMEKTNIDLPGETPNTIFHKLNEIGPVELATYAFGQGFQITPIQMICAVSAIANDGELMRPRVVEKIVDSKGNIVKKFEPNTVRQVISKDTSVVMRNILESVVKDGTGGNAYVKGYRVAGKTGTSEKLPRNSNKYIASFTAFAPADNPRISVLVLLDEPSAGVYYGGQIAAPVTGKIVDDTLRYLNVQPRYTQEEKEEFKEVTVPDIRELPLKNAIKKLKELGLKYKTEGEGDTVVEQMPKPGINVFKDSPIFIFLDKENQTSKVVVPDIIGKPVSKANKILSESGLSIKILGSGKAVSQQPKAGTEVEYGTIINVEFRDKDIKE